MTISNIRTYRNVHPKLGTNTFIDPTSVIIGDVSIGNESSVWPLVAIRGDVNHITIGERSNIQDGTIVHVSRKSPLTPKGFPTIIGNDVTVGHKVMLHGCELKNRILVGMGAIVMDGVVVEDDVIIAAGSLVPPRMHLLSGYLYKGSPAKQARLLTSDEIGFLKTTAANYVKLKDEYIEELS